MPELTLTVIHSDSGWLPAALALLLSSCASSASASRGSESATFEAQVGSAQKQQVLDLLESIETGDSKAIGVINPNLYVQHNLAAADGLAGFGALLQQLPAGSARVNSVRVFRDGEYVFTHTDYDFFGPKVGFDIFRFQDGKIVEHWDNLQQKPAAANPSGRTMIDGPTRVEDLPSTAANKALVRSFVEDILVNGKMSELAGYFDGDHYIQHNPQIADGLSGLGTALAALAARGIALEYDNIHLLLGEGNFVLVASEGSVGNVPSAFYDLFRVEAGKIAEHWDTIETIPSRDQWKNDNGKF